MDVPDPPLAALQERLAELRAAVDADDALGALTAATAVEPELLETYNLLVLRAREQGASWPEIGRAMGTSHQNAMKRFADYVDAAQQAAEETGSYTPGPQQPAVKGRTRLDPGRRRGR